MQYKALRIPENSLLRHSHSLFWGTHTNDEDIWREDSFYSLALDGKITLAVPTKVLGYTGAESLLLRNGTELKANAVILATGYGSSWTNIFSGMYTLSIWAGFTPGFFSENR